MRTETKTRINRDVAGIKSATLEALHTPPQIDIFICSNEREKIGVVGKRRKVFTPLSISDTFHSSSLKQVTTHSSPNRIASYDLASAEMCFVTENMQTYSPPVMLLPLVFDDDSENDEGAAESEEKKPEEKKPEPKAGEEDDKEPDESDDPKTKDKKARLLCLCGLSQCCSLGASVQTF